MEGRREVWEYDIQFCMSEENAKVFDEDLYWLLSDWDCV